MGTARYSKGAMYAADLSVYAKALSEESTNADTLKTLRGKVLRAIGEELSEKQREYIILYYGEGYSMTDIAARCGVDKSTVSRTIRRGEERLRRCLRFGAASLLDQAGVATPYHILREVAERG